MSGFLCPKCGRPFPTVNEVSAHTKKKHEDVPLPFSSEYRASIAEVEEDSAPKLRKTTGKKEVETEEEKTEEEETEEDEDDEKDKARCPDCRKVVKLTDGKPPEKCPHCGCPFTGR